MRINKLDNRKSQIIMNDVIEVKKWMYLLKFKSKKNISNWYI